MFLVSGSDPTLVPEVLISYGEVGQMVTINKPFGVIAVQVEKSRAEMTPYFCQLCRIPGLKIRHFQ